MPRKMLWQVADFPEAEILTYCCVMTNYFHVFTGAWQRERERKYPPKVNQMRGADWGDLAVIQREFLGKFKI